MGRWFIKYAPFALNNRFNLWYKNREMPKPPKESFGEWYKKNGIKDLHNL
jgi:L-lactate dehydrogenase complex protein LldF